jgi:hypothetical protein
VNEIDPKRVVVVDGVGEDAVARSSVGVAGTRVGVVVDFDTVAGDDVARSGRRTADSVVVRVCLDGHAIVAVGQHGIARGVDAYEVTLHLVARGIGFIDADAESGVTGDDVARRSDSTADAVVGLDLKTRSLRLPY